MYATKECTVWLQPTGYHAVQQNVWLQVTMLSNRMYGYRLPCCPTECTAWLPCCPTESTVTGYHAVEQNVRHGYLLPCCPTECTAWLPLHEKCCILERMHYIYCRYIGYDHLSHVEPLTNYEISVNHDQQVCETVTVTDHTL